MLPSSGLPVNYLVDLYFHFLKKFSFPFLTSFICHDDHRGSRTEALWVVDLEGNGILRKRLQTLQHVTLSKIKWEACVTQMLRCGSMAVRASECFLLLLITPRG